ncbi:double-stranded RNA-binding protein 4-like [Pyrus ussuriensis x Pyrus communis]|uniref:Double-stranded RNA-binding protein 4-like n=1 Tax=Pyrus ussuriensis x Pyrus communis TaxID=2448454 RepID=A0A5N5H714_9ROSA|nr:double-stranded RNA-binding protein 4-like [Pyrus ussuriensis x Pyrus communis]
MYKSRLQELCQQRKWRLPEYNTTKVGLDHIPCFSATVTINGFDFHTVDTFRSSKEAQNDAAKHAFDHLSDHPQPKPRNPIPVPSSFPQPCLPSSSSTSFCSALPSTAAADSNTTHEAPQIVQPKILEMHQIPPLPLQFSGNKSGATPQANATLLNIQHFHKNQLQTYAQKRNLLPPVYSCEREGPPHNSRFKSRVTIGGQTFEGQEFLPTLKDAEHAAAKAALMSILPNGVQEDDSGLFKNLLQELIQKEGFSIPVYSSRMTGKPHVPIFVSSVEIEGETFMGQEARSKKQAELSAAKVAYHTLRERKSSQLPLVPSSARKGQEASEILCSSFQSNPAAELHPQARPNAPAIFSPNTNTKEQKNEKNEAKRQRLITVSSGPCTPTSGGEGSSSDVFHGRAQETNHRASPVSQNGSTNCVMDSSLEPPTKRSAYNEVSVYSRKLNIEYPEGTTMLPMSDETWVVCSHT